MVHAMHWIAYLWQAQSRGSSLTLLDMVKRDQYQYDIAPEIQIEALEQANFIVCFKGRYMLAVDLGRLTLADLYQALPWKLPTASAYVDAALWTDEFKTMLDGVDQSAQKLLTQHLPSFLDNSS